MNESVHVKHVTSSCCGDPDDSANQSTLGEEDPGAAVVCTHTPATKSPDRTLQLRKALSRWENEGGADGHEKAHAPDLVAGRTDVNLTNAELVQMQVRIIALENLVTALFAGAPETVASLAREFAACISPRPGHTSHPLTLHAASQMLHITQRSDLFRERCGPSTSAPDID